MIIAFFMRLVTRTRRREMDKIAEDGLRAIEKDEFRAVRGLQPAPGETVESLSITGVYHRLGDEIQKATEEKRRARSAARRLAETIGVVPPRATVPAKCK
jgi:hypothetical protein